MPLYSRKLGKNSEIFQMLYLLLEPYNQIKIIKKVRYISRAAQKSLCLYAAFVLKKKKYQKTGAKAPVLNPHTK